MEHEGMQTGHNGKDAFALSTNRFFGQGDGTPEMEQQTQI